MSDQEIEKEIQAKGKTAPRLTPADIDAAIMSEHYFTALDGVDGRVEHFPRSIRSYDAESTVALACLTFCVLVLRNGFTMTGESACASPENFDAEIGRKVAREKAREKIWGLEGYLLRDRLAAAE